MMRFPSVVGSDLKRQTQRLPADFEGDLNVILIAFQQWQQKLIDTWIPFVQQLERDNPAIRYYELPVIQRLNWVARKFINEGMRAGIPDPIARERTITLYIDKDRFRGDLELPVETDIHLLLVSRDGRVHWRASGEYTQEKGVSLGDSVCSRLILM